MSNTVPVTVRILGKEYLVSCPEGEQESLQETARYLNGKMKEIRESSKIVGTDRIAVIAALNITHELLRAKGGQQEQPDKPLGARGAKLLQDKLELALNRFKQMDL
ncbi:MAG: hypothetical protein A2V90_00565 [Gammaproteobacteria bacterium RBG_16_57_12]|nr:MAG: hypothetical protein A2V90_00565 [Gammaproteobacteria bacterium RBG_16_57_12]